MNPTDGGEEEQEEENMGVVSKKATQKNTNFFSASLFDFRGAIFSPWNFHCRNKFAYRIATSDDSKK